MQRQSGSANAPFAGTKACSIRLEALCRLSLAVFRSWVVIPSVRRRRRAYLVGGSFAEETEGSEGKPPTPVGPWLIQHHIQASAGPTANV